MSANLRNPIFGRADESPEDDDTAFMLEQRLARLCAEIRTLGAKLDDHLPDPKYVGEQTADDWSSDVEALLSPLWHAVAGIEAKLVRARAVRSVRPVLEKGDAQ